MSSRAALTRMTREMKKWHIAGDPRALPAGCSVDLVGDSLLDLEARIAGPAGTPYDGGVFTLAVRRPAGPLRGAQGALQDQAPAPRRGAGERRDLHDAAE